MIASTGVLGEIMAEVQAVEEVLRAEVCSQVELVSEIGKHTLEAGGKRLRPALVILAARATCMPFDLARARRLGACMELIHMATLIHDDVIDHAATRRGKPTAASVYGNTASILSGDVLLSKAMAILAEDGDLRIIRCVSNAVVELAEGEVAELETRGQFDLTEAEHFRILRMKTASFIDACCRVGGLAANAPAPIVDALGTYGHHLGLAFQLIDDYLDYAGDRTKTGKPRATDFREGCPTLPLILNPDARLEPWFGSSGLSDDELEQAIEIMRQSGALDAAKRAAEQQGEKAIAPLADLPGSDDLELLKGVVRFVLDRQA